MIIELENAVETRAFEDGMKKIALTMVITILAFSLAGCGTAKESPGGSVSADVAEASVVVSEQSSGTESASAADGTVQPTVEVSGGTATASAAGGSQNDAFGVVAKSDNAVSGKDKEAVLNELDKELDSLFSNINKLEDVKDSDLELN